MFHLLNSSAERDLGFPDVVLIFKIVIIIKFPAFLLRVLTLLYGKDRYIPLKRIICVMDFNYFTSNLADVSIFLDWRFSSNQKYHVALFCFVGNILGHESCFEASSIFITILAINKE
jgi:hypothetical protein